MAASSSTAAARPKVPGAVNAAVVLVLVVLLAAVALTARQPSPPSIAELAPQAAQQIKDAPADQASQFGTGPGGEGGGGEGGPATSAPTTTTTTAAGGGPAGPVERARVRRCIGDPPRQIEDPQSPPCVPYFEGENGGATTKGVTRDEIRIAIPTTIASDDQNRAYEAFFNSRFELYGRKLNLRLYTPTAQTISEMLADAQTVDDMKVFADIAYQGGAGTDLDGREYYFYDELARRKVLSSQSSYNGPPLSDQAHLTSMAPYEWTYLPSVDQIEKGLGDMVCKGLVGKPPSYGGTGTSTAKARKFGVVQMTYTDGTPPLDVKPLTALLDGCAAPYVVVPLTKDQEGDAVAKLKLEEATTVIPLFHTATMVTVMAGSTANAYFPEWVASNFIHQDDDYAASVYPSEQAAHMIGLRSANKPGPLSDVPWYWARKEGDPSYDGTGEFGEWDFVYWNLLVLASGIQAAGPNLTPQTFHDGLLRTKFPNPGGGAAPYYQGTVGFGPSSRSMIRDFATVWWDGKQRSYETFGKTNGAYCYAERGQRYAPGARPAGDLKLYTGPCF
jgi:hypothetical protein